MRGHAAGGAPDVAVVVPARDEGESVTASVHAIRTAARFAVDRRTAAAVDLVVVAHRCSDSTAALATAALGAEGVCVVDDFSTTVGAARHHGVRTALRRRPSSVHQDRDLWIFSTDADSLVPVDWIDRGLAFAEAADAALVLGVTDLSGPPLHSSALARYTALLQGQRRSDHDHDHVYGANLAIRLDAYRLAGGFADLPADEDATLVRRCRAAGCAVATPTSWSVATSSRLRGRAVGGLATVLRDLVPDPAYPVEAVS